MTTQSLFVRDAWRFGDRATLNLGRALRAVSPLPAGAVQAGRALLPGGRLPGHARCSRGTTGRRAWGCPCRSTRTTGPCVKATYGWYNFATQATYGDTYNRNAANTTTYRWNDLNEQPGLRRRRVRHLRLLDRGVVVGREPGPEAAEDARSHRVARTPDRGELLEPGQLHLPAGGRPLPERQRPSAVRRLFASRSRTPTRDRTASSARRTTAGAVTYYDYTAAYAGSGVRPEQGPQHGRLREQLPQHRSGRPEAAVEPVAARHVVPGHPHRHVAQRHPAGSQRRELLPEVEVLGMGLQAVGQLRAAVADPGRRDVHEPERRRVGP